MLFASAGYNVSIYDVDQNQVQNALDNILVLLQVRFRVTLFAHVDTCGSANLKICPMLLPDSGGD